MDLRRLDLLILVACAVGRLTQWGHRDVEGLIAELTACGGRSVIAARWPIADVEAATLTTEIVHQYLLGLAGKTQMEPFARARALNRARCELVDHEDERVRIGMHLASAFEMYGLG